MLRVLLRWFYVDLGKFFGPKFDFGFADPYNIGLFLGRFLIKHELVITSSSHVFFFPHPSLLLLYCYPLWRSLSAVVTEIRSPVAPVAYQVIILEPGIGQFRGFEPR